MSKYLGTHVASDKRLYQENVFSCFSTKRICCGYTLEETQSGASKEYPWHVFRRAPWWIREWTLNLLGLSPLWFEPRSGHMWESQVLLTDGQVVFPRVLRFSPTFDERSA